MRSAPADRARGGGGLRELKAPSDFDAMDYLPIFIELRSQPVMLVGGGQTALRKLDLLRRTAAQVTIIAPRLHEALEARLHAGQFRHVPARFEAAQLDGASLVIAATNDREVNAAVAAAARARRIPVNVVDDPGLSSFIFPAIVDRSPLLVAVSSAGESPVLARRVREQIEALLPARLGALARFLGRRRKQVQQALQAPARRPFWERIIRGLTATHVLAGDDSAAGEAFDRELRTAHLTGAAERTPALGEVYLIGAGPGDPDLLTLRAQQLLQQADVILHDRLVPEAVLERARRDALRVFVGKGSQGEQATQEHIHELLLHFARQGKRVARLKGGDPFVFGRGGEEIEVLAAHGIPCIVVPGVTAALGAAAAAGIPLTHRQLASSLTLVTGHDLDSLDWAALARGKQTVVFYMGVAHLPDIVARLCAAGARPDCPACVVEQATLAGERVLGGALDTIAALAREHRVAAPSLLIVGEVAAFAAADALIASARAATAASGALA
jgi:uroporphyrin-III C-methyltransferase / precorrin-2 dehydrogenase / sirohydrochlorin ferrochelatase